MITVLYLIGCILTYIVFRKSQEIERYNLRKNLQYYFYKNSLDFLVPFIGVTFLFLLLSLLINIFITTDSTTLHVLIRTEENLEKLKSFFSIFKLNAVEAMLMLIVIYFLGFLRFFSQKSMKLFYLFDKYQLVIRRVYIVLVLLCSFTFFGTQLGEPTKDVSLQIKTIRDGYANLYYEIQEAISEEVAIQIYPKVHDYLPQQYLDALKLPTKIESEINSLANYYQKVSLEYGIKDNEIERIIDRGVKRTNEASDLNLEFSDNKRKSFDNEVKLAPGELNLSELNRTNHAINEFRKNLHSHPIELIQIEGRKKVICQIPKIITGEINKRLFQQIIQDYPILEPVMDVFFRTIDEKTEKKINQVIDNLFSSIMKNSDQVNQLIVEQASSIVKSEEIKITETDMANIDRESKVLNNEIKKVINARENLFESVIPKDIRTTLNPNLSVDIIWSPLPEATSYRIYWSNKETGPFTINNSIVTNSTSFEHWPDEFPAYYRIASVKNHNESKSSKISEIALYSNGGGSICEICGSKAIGYCHLRGIYVCNDHNVFTQKSGGRIRCP